MWAPLPAAFAVLPCPVHRAGPSIPHIRAYEFAPGVCSKDTILRVLKTAEYWCLCYQKNSISTFSLWLPPVKTTISYIDLFTPSPSIACMNPLKIQHFQPHMNSTFFVNKSTLRNLYAMYNPELISFARTSSPKISSAFWGLTVHMV